MNAYISWFFARAVTSLYSANWMHTYIIHPNTHTHTHTQHTHTQASRFWPTHLKRPLIPIVSSKVRPLDAKGAETGEEQLCVRVCVWDCKVKQRIDYANFAKPFSIDYLIALIVGIGKRVSNVTSAGTFPHLRLSGCCQMYGVELWLCVGAFAWMWSPRKLENPDGMVWSLLAWIWHHASTVWIRW
jgi:hypothetical protein